MSPLLVELFKAVFVAALFASLCAIARLAFLPAFGRRLKVTVGGFLAFMMLPLAYLYLRLALPAAAEGLLPFQAVAIWVYGPTLLVIMHVVMHQPLRAWQRGLYAMPPLLAFSLTVAAETGALELPEWWELLSLTQALAFAAAACTWTVRRRGQLRVLANAFPVSSFAMLLYLSVGLLLLLAADFHVHWRQYFGPALPLQVMYAWVAPVALYSIGVSVALVWHAAAVTEPAPPDEVSAPVEPRGAEGVARRRELSESAARALAENLEQLVHEKRLHTRNDLCLDDLAAALQISSHLTSELLNAHLQVSFYEFVNRHRAKEAADLLRAGQGRFTLADVAYEAGFNNPNTFHREFKRTHGVTPAEYRRGLRAASSSERQGELAEPN